MLGTSKVEALAVMEDSSLNLLLLSQKNKLVLFVLKLDLG